MEENWRVFEEYSHEEISENRWQYCQTIARTEHQKTRKGAA